MSAPHAETRALGDMASVATDGDRPQVVATVDAAPERVISRPAAAFVAGSVVLANAATYGFQIATGRFLGTEAYGLLAGLMAVVGVLSVATGSMQSVAAKAVASGRVITEPSSFDRLSRSTTLAALAATGVMLALSPVLAGFLRTGVLPVAVLALFIVPAALAAIGIGRMQGALRYVAMAALSASLALSKFASAIAVGVIGLGVTTLIAALILGTCAVAVAALRSSRSVGSISTGVLDRDTARVIIGLTLFWILLSVDVPFARNAFSEEAAGQYAAAAVVARIVLWMPAVVVQVMFPRMSQAVERSERTGRMLVGSLCITVGIAAAGVAGIALFGEQIFQVAFGAEYLPAANYAWKLALAVAPFTVVNLLLFHHLARSRWRFAAIVLVALSFEVVGLAFAHESPDQFAVVLGASGCVAAIGLIPTGGWDLMRNRFRRASTIVGRGTR